MTLSYGMRRLVAASIVVILTTSSTTQIVFSKPNPVISQVFDEFIQHTPALPRYMEAGYSPLGRSPVVDALLGDPFYMPQYAKTTAELIKTHTSSNKLSPLSSALFIAGGISITPIDNPIPSTSVPSEFLVFEPVTAKRLYEHWTNFIHIREEVISIYSVLTEEEKRWLRENYNRFFFESQSDDSEYDAFTTENPYPLKFFALAARLNLAKLASCAVKLSTIVDEIYRHRDEYDQILLTDDFVWEENGVRLIISQKNHVTHRENADLFIDLGGSNVFYSNAGGTEGVRPLALHVDLKGNNDYKGHQFVQGSGFLGIGILASFGGNNRYMAKQYSQGCGFFGIGILMTLDGINEFKLNFGGQSFALFGASILWTKQGNNLYLARQGMAQAASSTLGVAFLVDNQGENKYICGTPDHGGKRDGGIGQGGSMGVRGFPWLNNPSFYGGLAFLYTGGNNNSFSTAWLGQGSAYFLGAGILVAEGEGDTFTADYDSQGQGLHLAAGLLLKTKGYNVFSGGWGSLGVGGDRSVGMCICNGGNNVYSGTDQSIGTARKAKALGVFIDIGGNNHYNFQKISNANIQLPAVPKDWPRGLFLQWGDNNVYPEYVDEFKRTDSTQWGIYPHSIGVSTPEPMTFETLLEKCSKTPNVPFPFDPVRSWSTNTAFRPLADQSDRQLLANEILFAGYERRRQIYETLDFMRFTNRNLDVDLNLLLESVVSLEEDQFNYAVLWALRHKEIADLSQIKKALNQNLLTSEYVRKMAVPLIGTFWPEDAVSILEKIMLEDDVDEIRYQAALALTLNLPSNSVAILRNASGSDVELVRYAIAKGLQENSNPYALSVVMPLLNDPSFYVRRAAALTAISLKHKEAIPVLFETLDYETLDLTENYGDNIFKHLAIYLGVDFGLDKQAWIDWWQSVHTIYKFPKD